MTQICILSPDSQKVIGDLDDLGGVRFSGVNVNIIRCAVGTALIGDSEEKLQELVETLHGACAARDLHINIGRGETEVMALAKRFQDLILNINS